jgi:4-hydroxybenzoate polyprenyltransferase
VSTAAPVYARRFVSLVKFEHTVFALPFAFVGAILSVGEIPPASTLFWIVAAMVGARSLAMALNRLIDAEIDARNPRTANREIPAGLLTRGQVVAFCIASLALFLLAVWQLDPLVRWLWPIPVAAFVAYPYLKRFTWLCHLGLGIATGMAPAGAWLAVTGDASWQPFALWAAVCLWIGGFDIIYATGDVDFDRREGLHSLPARFGIAAGLTVTRACHVAAIALLVAVGISLDRGALYFLGLAVVAALLAYENSIVRPDDLSRVNVAFFTLNGVISMVFLAGVLADVLI